MVNIEKEELVEAMEMLITACEVADSIIDKHNDLTDNEVLALRLMIDSALAGCEMFDVGCGGILYDENDGMAFNGDLEKYFNKTE